MFKLILNKFVNVVLALKPAKLTSRKSVIGKMSKKVYAKNKNKNKRKRKQEKETEWEA